MVIKSDSDGGLTTLSFESHIVPEFITDNATPSSLRPHSLSEYYVGGTADVPVASPENDNISTTGPIKFSDFYGAVNAIAVTFTSNQYTINGVNYTANMNDTLNLYDIASQLTAPTNNTISAPIIFTMDYDTIFNNSVILGGNFNDVVINNYGIICGRGGHGYIYTGGGNTASKSNIGGASVSTGNPAIYVGHDVTKFSLVNYANGFIAGGGNATTNATGVAGNNFRESYYLYGEHPLHKSKYNFKAFNGNGGGWNGGVGGGRRAIATTLYFEAKLANQNPDVPFDVESFGSQYAEEYDPSNADAFISYSDANKIIVTSRSANGTQGHSGAASSVMYAASSKNNQTDPNPSDPPSASAPSGGTGLNGGGRGTGGGGVGVFGSPAWQEVAAKARSASGSGGGNGIGSGSGIVNSNGIGTTGAGGGHSFEISGSVTVGSSSFINGGRRYGSSDITVTAP